MYKIYTKYFKFTKCRFFWNYIYMYIYSIYKILHFTSAITFLFIMAQVLLKLYIKNFKKAEKKSPDEGCIGVICPYVGGETHVGCAIYCLVNLRHNLCLHIRDDVCGKILATRELIGWLHQMHKALEAYVFYYRKRLSVQSNHFPNCVVNFLRLRAVYVEDFLET